MHARVGRFAAVFQSLLLLGSLLVPALVFADQVQENGIAVTLDTGPTGGTTQNDHVSVGTSRTASYRIVATGGDSEAD